MVYSRMKGVSWQLVHGLVTTEATKKDRFAVKVLVRVPVLYSIAEAHGASDVHIDDGRCMGKPGVTRSWSIEWRWGDGLLGHISLDILKSRRQGRPAIQGGRRVRSRICVWEVRAGGGEKKRLYVLPRRDGRGATQGQPAARAPVALSCAGGIAMAIRRALRRYPARNLRGNQLHCQAKPASTGGPRARRLLSISQGWKWNTTFPEESAKDLLGSGTF